jgi:SHS2 domain-containing protein
VYRWAEHTGELEIEIEAESEAGVFAEGLEAMRELLRDGGDGEAVERMRIVLEATDRAALLADWLGELAFLAETQGFVPERLASLELAGEGLVAEVAGSMGEPSHLVKAATYHRLEFERVGSRWRARVILDV